MAAKLRAHPGLVECARARTQAWYASGCVHEEYVRAWQKLLSLPLEQLCLAITDASERGRALRQVSPFAGTLAARERWAIHRSVSASGSADAASAGSEP